MAIADIFLKVQGATGEASDHGHEGEIEVVSWSGGMDAPTTMTGGQTMSRAAVSVSELSVVKRVDKSSPTLMGFLRNRKLVPTTHLVVRKAGATPFEYFKIQLTDVRVTGLKVETQGTELLEHLRLAFAKVLITYTPQGTSGGSGGGASMFETDAGESR